MLTEHTLHLSSADAQALVAAGPAKLNRAITALKRWRRRQDRTEHPDGEFDRAGRWYPSDAENCDDFTCYTRSPTRGWPYSYMRAARGLEHCSALDGADPDDLKLVRRVAFRDRDYIAINEVTAARLLSAARAWVRAHPSRCRIEVDREVV